MQAVAGVESFGDGERTIVHVADYHLVPPDDFRAKLPEDVTEAEAEPLYEGFLETVDAVQAEQVEVLRALDVRSVWIERLTDQDVEGVHKLAEFMGVLVRAAKEQGEGVTGPLKSDQRAGGAAYHLLVEGEIDRLRPADDAELLDAANPLVVGWDSPKIAERERKIVERVTADGGPVEVLVCGGSHRLEKYLPEGWRLVRVEVKAWRKAVAEE
jgi:hypothetical protein